MCFLIKHKQGLLRPQTKYFTLWFDPEDKRYVVHYVSSPKDAYVFLEKEEADYYLTQEKKCHRHGRLSLVTINGETPLSIIKE